MTRSSVGRDFYETEYHFDYDVRFAMEARLRRALDLLAPLEDKAFLDLGSGVGWAAHLAGLDGAGPVIGFDFAQRALMLGQRNIGGVERVRGDGCALPFCDASFDRALSFGSLEHFVDVDAGLRELAARVAAGRYRGRRGSQLLRARTEQPQELRLSYRGWRRRFEQAGLRVLVTRSDPGPPVLRDRRPLRVAVRAAAKVLAHVPYLPYQFIFQLEHARSKVAASPPHQLNI